MVVLSPVNITYNSAGQMTIWKQGFYEEQRSYTTRGQIESIKLAADIITKYSYTSGADKVRIRVRLRIMMELRIRHCNISVHIPTSYIYTFKCSYLHFICTSCETNVTDYN